MSTAVTVAVSATLTASATTTSAVTATATVVIVVPAWRAAGILLDLDELSGDAGVLQTLQHLSLIHI